MDKLIDFLFWSIVISFWVYVIAVISALNYNNKLKKEGYTGIPWEECFQPKKHFSFLVGWTIGLIPKHILIQYSMRFLARHCQICQMTGVCVNEFTGNKTCGCDPFKMACSPFEKCKNGHYGKIIWNKKKAWEYLNKVKPFLAFNNIKDNESRS